jgi:hypothetical protein
MFVAEILAAARNELIDLDAILVEGNRRHEFPDGLTATCGLKSARDRAEQE